MKKLFEEFNKLDDNEKMFFYSMSGIGIFALFAFYKRYKKLKDLKVTENPPVSMGVRG